MSPILVAILEALIPTLVQQAEGLFPSSGSGAEKYAWVQGMTNELISAVAKRFNFPAWLNPILGEAEVLFKELLEKEVARLDPPDAPQPAA